MTGQRICKRPDCDNPLPEGAVAQRRYCSPECQQGAKKRYYVLKYPDGIEKICPVCGDPFQTGPGTGIKAIHCGWECKQIATREYNRIKQREHRAKKKSKLAKR